MGVARICRRRESSSSLLPTQSPNWQRFGLFALWLLDMSECVSSNQTQALHPSHPERTLLYSTIAEHFETWLDLASPGQFDGQGCRHRLNIAFWWELAQ